MNKCAIALAIVAVCAAGLVAANKGHQHGHHSDDDWEFEGGHHGGHHLEQHPRSHGGHQSHQSHHNHDGDNNDWEVNRHGGFHNCNECTRPRPSHKVSPHSGHSGIKRTGGAVSNSGSSAGSSSSAGNTGSTGSSGSSSGANSASESAANSGSESAANSGSDSAANSGSESAANSGSESVQQTGTGNNHSGQRRGGSTQGNVAGNREGEAFEGRTRFGNRRVGGAGVGAVGAAGAAGEFREHDGQSANLEGRTRLANRKSIQGHKNFGAGENKTIRGGRINHARDENEGIRKHQVLNRDKTIIKDRTTGVNDVDGFRHSSEKTNGAGFEAGDSKFIGANAGGSAHSDREFDNKFAAGENLDRDVEASGSIGQVGAAGAGVGGAQF